MVGTVAIFIGVRCDLAPEGRVEKIFLLAGRSK